MFQHTFNPSVSITHGADRQDTTVCLQTVKPVWNQSFLIEEAANPGVRRVKVQGS